jgi:putative hydrolase of the HAD superfamily
MGQISLSNKKAIFFDAGNTLIYAHPSGGEIYEKVSTQLGAKGVSAELLSKRFVQVFEQYMSSILSDSKGIPSSDELDWQLWRRITFQVYQGIDGLKGIDFDTWFQRLYDVFGRAETWRMYEDVKEVLPRLRSMGFRLGVVSNWDTRLKAIIKGTGLEGMLDFSVFSAEVGVRKPDVRIFEEALKVARVSPQEALHVGDLYEEDVLGARAAGIDSILLDRQQRYIELAGTLRISSLNELLELL